MENICARGSCEIPWGPRRNESTGVTPEARKYMVAHGKNIAFGDVPGIGYEPGVTVGHDVSRKAMEAPDFLGEYPGEIFGGFLVFL